MMRQYYKARNKCELANIQYIIGIKWIHTIYIYIYFIFQIPNLTIKVQVIINAMSF